MFVAKKLRSGFLLYSVDFSNKTICMLDNLKGSPRGAKGKSLGSLHKDPIDLSQVCTTMNTFISKGDTNNKGFLCAVLRDFISKKSFHDKLNNKIRKEILDAVKLYY